MLKSLPKPKQPKSIFWLTAVLAIIGAFLATFASTWVLSRFQSSPIKGAYEIASNLAAPQEIDRVIKESVNLSSDFTSDRIAKYLVATEIDSGGTTFIIYRFNFPQTCGKAGCLHVAVDRRDHTSIPLQLFDLPDRTLPFTKLSRSQSF
jgi:hypothetical protein